MGKEKYHHGSLKQSLVEAALVEIEQVGAEGLSLRALSRRIGVSPNAPYRHFPSKAALIADVATHGYGQLSQLLNDLPANSDSLPNAIEQYVAYLEKRPGLAAVLMDSGLSNQDNANLQAARSDLFGAWLRHVKPRQPEAAASSQIARVTEIWAMAEGFLQLRRSGALQFLPDTIRPSARQLGTRV